MAFRNLKQPRLNFEYRPAPGFRHGPSGTLIGTGNYGYSYSSSASGTNSIFLHFSTHLLSLADQTYCTSGLQLRCLSE